MIGAGTFASNIGVVTLNGAPTIGDNTEVVVSASGSTGTIYTYISQSGAMTLSIGTGAVTLNGDGRERLEIFW